MAKQSAGLLPFREHHGTLEVFLVHPGGPFWARKDDGAWSLAKGEYEPGEDPETVARREFEEETGFVPRGRLLPIGTVTQKGGKHVVAWAFHADFDPARLRSNTFSMEWPPKSGKRREFPEVDRAGWFPLTEARRKILPGQAPFLDALARVLENRAGGA